MLIAVDRHSVVLQFSNDIISQQLVMIWLC